MADFLKLISEIRQSGSPSAFQSLVEMFEPNVFTMCYRIIRNREEAEEAAQDVFLKCYRNIHKIKEPEKFPQWLLKIAYSKSIDYVRKKKLQTVNIENIPEISTTNETKSKGDLNNSEIFEGALMKLNPIDKAIVHLYYQESLPIKEIVSVMDMSESNIKIRLHRSRTEIRKILEAQSMINKK